MKQPKFNPEQITKLLKNKHVAKCSATNITYSKAFRVAAVKQYAEGMTSRQIFKMADLESELIGKNTAKNCLARWRKILEAKGEAGLLAEARGSAKGNKGGRPKTTGLTDADRIKRLEIENAYLRAENDFLAKLRAQRKS
jgi:transposase-like protein